MKFELLLSEKEISEKVKEIAEEVTRSLRNEKVVIVGVLKGALFFMADLLRELKFSFVYDFIQVKSYEGMQTTGSIKVLKEPNCDINGKTVLIVEDILDTGLTLSFIRDYLIEKGAKKVYVCALLDKKKKRLKEIKADFVGFEIDDQFVVGYGLDCDEKMRELKDIFILKQC